MLLDKAEPGKGSCISLSNLQDAIKWVLEAHVTLEDSAKLLSAASDVLPVMLELLEVAFSWIFTMNSFMILLFPVHILFHHMDLISYVHTV
jgi:hypothetical protein